VSLAVDVRERHFRWRGTRSPNLSAVLAKFAASEARDRATIFDLIGAMGDRAFGALLICFAIPNMLPVPGISTVMAIPLLYLSTQLIAGRSAPRLPRTVAPRAVKWRHFERLLPWIARAERLSYPRLPLLVSSTVERAIGMATLVFSLVLLLPIPFGNMLPAAAIALFGLALLQKDGFATLLGIGASLLSGIVIFGVAWAALASAWLLLSGV
jgi:hypothetical protein